jgi:hypothetical protein
MRKHVRLSMRILQNLQVEAPPSAMQNENLHVSSSSSSGGGSSSAAAAVVVVVTDADLVGSQTPWRILIQDGGIWRIRHLGEKSLRSVRYRVRGQRQHLDLRAAVGLLAK